MVKISVTIRELLEIFSKSEIQKLNTILRIRFLELNNSDDLMTIKSINEVIENKISSYVNKKLKSLLGKNNYLVDISNDAKLGIEDVLSFFSECENKLVCFQIRGEFYELSGVINGINKNFNLNINVKLGCSSFNMLDEKVKDLLKKYNYILEKAKQIIYDQYNKKLEKYKKEWTQKRERQYLELRNIIRTQACKENDCYK